MKEKSKIILNDNNVLKLMKYIVENNIVNVRHYLNNELNSSYPRYLLKLDKIKEKYPDLYLQYEKNLQDNYNIVKENIKIIFLYIATYKKYGILYEDGFKRKFDYFDMYVLYNKYFYNFKKKELLKILEELDKQLIYMNLRLNLLDVRYLINMMFNKTMTIDRFDVYINKDYIYNEKESGLDLEEKDKLVSFINENKIPLNLGNYNFGSKKMIKQRNNPNDLFNLNMPMIDNTKKIK